MTLFEEISNLDTEIISSKFSNIDTLSIQEILEVINSEDATISASVKLEIPYIVAATELIINSFRSGGRLIYIGAGTSGRLGVLDAAECPPTFGTDPLLVQGYIAGGKAAAFCAIEGAEDNTEDAIDLLNSLNITQKDTICGLAASGRTPFVVTAIKEANMRGAKTILITTNRRSKLKELNINADVLICPFVGPEVIAGSTRMKSGTAQKLVLNMLTTTAMIKMGKTYNNIMIDLRPTNNKLQQRAKRILMELTGAELSTSEEILIKTNWRLKPALVMLIADVELLDAEIALNKSNGIVKEAIAQIIKNK